MNFTAAWRKEPIIKGLVIPCAVSIFQIQGCCEMSKDIFHPTADDDTLLIILNISTIVFGRTPT
jgi:hypothetical protein